MSGNTGKLHWQETLEGVGVPVSLAQASADILEKEAQDTHYRRTPEEKETINHAYTWWVAQGQQTTTQETSGN